MALIVEYDGTGYHGSQLQASAPTIQEVIEEALCKLSGEKIRVKMASRTDSGVHAEGQVVSFRTESSLPAETFVRGLNHYLPGDVAVKEAYRVDDSFDGAKEQLPSDLSLENFRAGFVSWMSVGTRTFFDRFLSIWGEMWSEFAYETTNFSDEGQDDYYILQLTPLVGLYADFGKFSVQPYYKLDLRRDFGGRTWNKEPWLNRSKHGPGIRIPIQQFIKMDHASIYLFAEYMDIKYHSRVGDERLKDWASYDYRTGLQFWIPLWPRPK